MILHVYSAIEGLDFSTSEEYLRFDSEVTVGNCLDIHLEIHDDKRLESNESLILTLTSTIPASPAVKITQNITRVLILDNDSKFEFQNACAHLNLQCRTL